MCKTCFLAVGAALSVAGSAAAQPIFDTFGAFPNATFGGTGIPNDSVAASTQVFDGDVIITMAMSATQRFSNPALTNDGAGTYFATSGSNFGGNGQSANEGALWNFNYYIEVEGVNGATPVLSDYQFDLFYDFDPSEDTARNTLSRIDLTAFLAATSPTQTLLQDSQNLLFNFLATPTPGLIFPQAGGFDPDALGEYNFAITVARPGGFALDTVAIDVQVVPAPASLALLGGAGFVASRRRR